MRAPAPYYSQLSKIKETDESNTGHEADCAGVTTKTLKNWCEPFLKELETMGMQPHMKVLPPHIVRFITEKFCIDVGE